MLRLLSAALTAAAIAVPLAAQQATASAGNTFDWSGEIPAGNWIRVRDLNGSISVEPGTGNTVQVHGEKQWRRGDPSRVRFEVYKGSNGVTVCALWNEDDTCDENGMHSHGDHHTRDGDDVSVHFTVHLPAGVKVDAGTVNGSLDVQGARAEVVATTVNGRIDAATTQGPVRAETVNGSINVRMDSLPGSGDLDYSTVNGSVTAMLPASLSAVLDMETVNGSISSDFPLTVSGKLSPRHIRATIGSGGREVRLHTVNGSVELRKLD
jgi:hypothetical protein